MIRKIGGGGREGRESFLANLNLFLYSYKGAASGGVVLVKRSGHGHGHGHRRTVRYGMLPRPCGLSTDEHTKAQLAQWATLPHEQDVISPVFSS